MDLNYRDNPEYHARKIGRFVGGSIAIASIIHSLGMQFASPPTIHAMAMNEHALALSIGLYGHRQQKICLLDGDAEPVTVDAGKAAIYALAFSRDGTMLACGGKDCHVRLIGVHRGIELRKARPSNGGYIDAVHFSLNGKYIFLGAGNSIRLYDIYEWKEVWRQSTGFSNVQALDTSPDGKVLAASGSKGVIYLYDMVTGHKICDLHGHTYPVVGLEVGVRQVHFSPDGNQLVSAGHDKTVRIWDLANRECIYTLTGHSAPVSSVRFSPCGQFVVSSGDDGTVRVWDAHQGIELRIIQRYKKAVVDISFSTPHNVVSVTEDWSIEESPLYTEWSPAEELRKALEEPSPGTSARSFCINCGQLVPSHANFCPHCGSAQHAIGPNQ